MKIKQIITAVIVVAIVCTLGWYFIFYADSESEADNAFSFGDSQSATGSITSTEPLVPAPTDLNQLYENGMYGFTFKYPSTYTVSKIDSLQGDTIVVQDDKGNGFQIIITPFSEPSNILTEERIRTDIPDMQIDGVTPVLLGANGQGIAFLSDNDAFGGASREVWFVFGGNLYQISTYLKNDPVLQAVMGTWEFRR